MEHHSAGGGSIPEVLIMIVGSLISLGLAALDHVINPSIEIVDIVMGLMVKGTALAVSILTGIYIRMKIKKIKKDGKK